MIYTLVQVVVNGTLANPAATERPLAEAARNIFGREQRAAIASGALISIYGYLGANMLHTPRLTFALAERGDFPRFFAAVHPKFRTPHVSIVRLHRAAAGVHAGGNFPLEHYAFRGGAAADVFLVCDCAAGAAAQAAAGGCVSRAGRDIVALS